MQVEGFQPTFFEGKKLIAYLIMTCKMLCLIKGQSGSVSLAAYPISTVVPLDLSMSALYVNHILPDIKSFNIQQVVMFLVETICCCM